MLRVRFHPAHIALMKTGWSIYFNFAQGGLEQWRTEYSDYLGKSSRTTVEKYFTPNRSTKVLLANVLEV